MTLISRLRTIFLTPLGRRMTREERNESRGVALLMVMMGIAIMTAVVSDLNYNETVRYQMCVHTRDSVKAEALAAGGLNWGRLFLVIQGKIQNFITTFAGMGVPLPAYTVWDLLPLDSDVLKGLTSGDIASSFGLDMTESLAARAEKRKEQQEKKGPEDQGNGGKKSVFDAPEGGFGNFEGSFTLKFVDEESKISIQDFGSTTDGKKRSTIRKLLASLIAPKRYDDLFENRGVQGSRADRPSVIANIFDWIDANELRTDAYVMTDEWGRVTTGAEQDVYANDKDLKPKNAYFDSLDELRLVHGVTDEFEQAFFDSITIYGQGGKINILSAKDQVIEAIMRFCALNVVDPLFENVSFADEAIKKWRDYGVEGLGPVSVKGFLTFLESTGLTVDRAACEGVLDVKSTNFTITSKATVNDVTRTLTLVARVVNNAEEINYFRSR